MAAGTYSAYLKSIGGLLTSLTSPDAGTTHQGALGYAGVLFGEGDGAPPKSFAVCGLTLVAYWSDKFRPYLPLGEPPYMSLRSMRETPQRFYLRDRSGTCTHHWV